MATIDLGETAGVNKSLTGTLTAGQSLALTLGADSVTRVVATGKKINYTIKVEFSEVTA